MLSLASYAKLFEYFIFQARYSKSYHESFKSHKRSLQILIGPWPDPCQTLSGPWPYPGRTLAGPWPDPGRTLAGPWLDSRSGRTLAGLSSDPQQTLAGPLIRTLASNPPSRFQTRLPPDPHRTPTGPSPDQRSGPAPDSIRHPPHNSSK